MNNDELYTEKTCCGCGACAVKCPRNAIVLNEDEYGFEYPQINQNLCIDCGICKKTCDFLKNKKENEYSCYAGANSDDDLIKKSASGGLFSAIAQDFLKKGGYVCGAVAELNEGKIKVEHKVIKNINDLYKLQGSKYVQSSTVEAFKKIEKLLKNGEKVLFSGTPCQVGAIKSICDKYVGINLFTIDLICHGVPSQKILNGYLKEYQKQKKSLLTYIDFRNKKYGWGLTGIAKFENGNIDKVTIENSSYYKMFLEGEIYRESCYNCTYANLNRVGDITIGDYWGVQDLSPEILNNKDISKEKGVSCIIINNEIGKEMIREYGNNMIMYSVDINKLLVINKQLKEPANCTVKRKKYLNIFSKKGYLPIERQFRIEYKLKTIKKIIKKMIPLPIKKIIKNIFRKLKSSYTDD